MVGDDESITFAPPELMPELEGPSRDMYDLIYRRTLASVMPPAVSSSTTYTITARSPLHLQLGEDQSAVHSAVLKTSATELLFEGFLAAMGSHGTVSGREAKALFAPMAVGQRVSLTAVSSQGDGNLSSIDTNSEEGESAEGEAGAADDRDNEEESTRDSSKGANGNVVALKECPGLVGAEHETRPPSRFTVPSFIHELESVGVGRPSTYSYILEKLKSMGYVLVDGKTIIPTVKGLRRQAVLTNFSDSVSVDECRSLQ
ncbi:topA, partial [Symbiodinium microadriaticum]